MSHVVLIGEMGAGKTTVGIRLAGMLQMPLLDSDQMLQDRIGRTGAGLAEAEGVDALHELELDMLLEAVSNTEPAVICPAASVIDVESGREALEAPVVVWLDVSIVTALNRTRGGDHRRDVDVKEAEALRQRRLRHYRSLSDMRVNTEMEDPADIAARIERALPGLR